MSEKTSEEQVGTQTIKGHDQPGTFIPGGPFKPPVVVTPGLPERRNGKLTRKGMEHVIRQGGSVVPAGHQGAPVARIEDLPSEAELAAGDEQAEADARESIQRRREALEREEALLAKRAASPKMTGGTGPQGTGAVKAEPPEEPRFGTGNHPLSYFDGKDDNAVLSLKGIGPETLKEIREAQAKSGK